MTVCEDVTEHYLFWKYNKQFKNLSKSLHCFLFLNNYNDSMEKRRYNFSFFLLYFLGGETHETKWKSKN